MSIATARAAMGTALRTCSAGDGTLRATDYIPDTFAPPCAFFDYSFPNPNATFAGGASEIQWRIVALASRTPAEASQKVLDQLRDPTSATGLKRVIEASGACDALEVTSIGEIELLDMGGTEYLGCTVQAVGLLCP